MSSIDAWEEVAIVSIQRYSATTPIKLQASAMTETVDISEPDYPGESVNTLAGGRIWKQSPQEDGEITLELYPTALDIDTTTSPAQYYGLFQFYPTNQTIDVSTPDQPMTTITTAVAGVQRTRDRYAVSILWTNGVTQDAFIATTASSDSLRFTALGCRMTSHKAAYTDGVLKVTATFKFPAMNKAGDVKMCRWDSGDATALGVLFTDGTYDNEDAWT